MTKGTVVQFKDRKGNSITGVVVETSYGKKVNVATPQGQFSVPVSLISTDQLPKAAIDALLQQGTAFNAKRAENQAEAKEKRQAFDKKVLETFEYRPGDEVTYMCSDFRVGHQKTKIVAVDKEKGTVTVINPKAMLRDKVKYFGIEHIPTKLLNAQDTVTVSARSVRPA